MSAITLTTTAVVNQCHGGYRLSEKAARKLAARKGLLLERQGPLLYVKGQKRALESIVPRNDPDLIQIVRQLGKEADGECADLRIVEITVTIDLDAIAGYERIGRAHAESR